MSSHEGLTYQVWCTRYSMNLHSGLTGDIRLLFYRCCGRGRVGDQQLAWWWSDLLAPVLNCLGRNAQERDEASTKEVDLRG